MSLKHIENDLTRLGHTFGDDLLLEGRPNLVERDEPVGGAEAVRAEHDAHFVCAERRHYRAREHGPAIAR